MTSHSFLYTVCHFVLRSSLDLTCADFSTEARILYTSDSIVDVLGYTPEDVVERSCWEFFSPEDIPHAKHLHQRGIETDRAASLVYCRVKAKDGNWIGCECCFTIVHDVVVACTSVYKSTISSQSKHDTAEPNTTS